MNETAKLDDQLVPEIWVCGLRDILKVSITVNGAIVLAVPTLLKLGNKASVVLNTTFGIGIAGLITAVFGLLWIAVLGEPRTEGVSHRVYRVARSAAVLAAFFGCMALVMVGTMVYINSHVSVLALWVPLLFGPAGFVLLLFLHIMLHWGRSSDGDL